MNLQNKYNDNVTLLLKGSFPIHNSPLRHLENSDFILNDIMIWLKNTFENEANNKGLEFIVPDTDKLQVYGDKLRLKSVFSNLFLPYLSFQKRLAILLDLTLIEG